MVRRSQSQDTFWRRFPNDFIWEVNEREESKMQIQNQSNQVSIIEKVFWSLQDNQMNLFYPLEYLRLLYVLNIFSVKFSFGWQCSVHFVLVLSFLMKATSYEQYLIIITYDYLAGTMYRISGTVLRKYMSLMKNYMHF